jgi:hypothetical protein
MEQVANLTMRQIALIYYRERDKKGVPKPIRSGRNKKKNKEQVRDEFFALAEAFGLSEQEIERQWQESLNGKE